MAKRYSVGADGVFVDGCRYSLGQIISITDSITCKWSWLSYFTGFGGIILGLCAIAVGIFMTATQDPEEVRNAAASVIGTLDRGQYQKISASLAMGGVVCVLVALIFGRVFSYRLYQIRMNMLFDRCHTISFRKESDAQNFIQALANAKGDLQIQKDLEPGWWFIFWG